MTDIVTYVQENKDEFANYEYLQQFAQDAEGLRFNDEIPFDRMNQNYGLDVVWGGISGERQIREYLETDLLEGTITRDNFRGGLSTDELNDLINYHAWNTYDTLALRATEGESEIIPRQEYEFLSTTWAIQRWPEIFKALVDKIGLEGVIETGLKSRKELGSSLSNAIGWSYFVVPGFGAIGLEQLDMVSADDPLHIDKKKVCMNVGTALEYGARGEDGYLLPSQNRYVNQIKDDEVIEFIEDHLVELDGPTKANLRQFNAAGELFSFLLHYDNRVGLFDHGPYFVEDGKPMVVREIGLNRPFLPWNDMAEDRDLPITATVALVIDPAELDLQEIRNPMTVFTHPSDYLSAVERGAVFLRHQPEQVDPLPLDELEIADINDRLPELTARANDAIQEWYKRTTRLSRREKIMNGAITYSIGMITPLLRATGTYEYFCEELDLWEMPPMSSEFYYHTMGGFAQEQMPMQIMFGYGWSEIPDETADESGYAEYLEEAHGMNWKSDLSGMLELPDYWAEKTDENDLLDVPLQLEGEMDRQEFAEFVRDL